jgi:hypothetical protein
MVQTGSLVLGYIGLGVFLLGPAVFNGQISSFSTKKVRLQFFPDHLIVEISNEDTDALETTDEIDFSDMVNYRTGYALKNESFSISFLLSDGRKFDYAFWPTEQAAPEDEVRTNLDALIKAYNKRPDADHTVAYRFKW